MSKINYNESLIGEVFPLGNKAFELGHLAFTYNQTLTLTNYKCNGCFVCTADRSHKLKFRWKITPLSNGKVIITATHPLDKTNVIMSLLTHGAYPLMLFVEVRPLPVNEEEVLDRWLFNLNYVEGSPLFFELKASNHCYLTTVYDPRSFKWGGDTFYEIGCFFDEEMKKSPYVQDNIFNWFLEIDALATSDKAKAKLSNRIPFQAISERVGYQIDETYLQKKIGHQH